MADEINDIIEELKAKLKSIESKIVFNHLPIAPRNPYPPRKSKNLLAGKPHFFQVNAIIINAIIWVLPIIYFQFLFFRIQVSNTVIFVLLAALISRLIVHLKETEDFSKETEAYNLSFRKYEDKLNIYNLQKLRYEDELKQYNLVKLKDDHLKKERAQIQNELDSIFDILGAKHGSIYSRGKHTYLYSAKQKEAILAKIGRRSSSSSSNNLESKLNDYEVSDRIKKGIDFISKLSSNQRKEILGLLKKVQFVQNSELNNSDKAAEIKRILWTQQSSLSKLVIGGLIGTIGGLLIFGTGGIGIAGLGSAVGIWGFLTGTLGGVVISSIIQNFEK